MFRNLVMGAIGVAVALTVLYFLTWGLKKAPAPVSTVGAAVEKFTQPH